MPSITWKSLACALLASWLGGAVCCMPAAAQGQGKPVITVTLLGTGSPIPEPGRTGAGVTERSHERGNAGQGR